MVRFDVTNGAIRSSYARTRSQSQTHRVTVSIVGSLASAIDREAPFAKERSLKPKRQLWKVDNGERWSLSLWPADDGSEQARGVFAFGRGTQE